MEFVAFLGSDKENWGQIGAIMRRLDAVPILIKSKKTEDFEAIGNARIVSVDTDKPLIELKEEIIDKVKPLLLSELEVAISLASGNGKEHMALISALLSIPVGIRLVVFTKNGVEYIN